MLKTLYKNFFSFVELFSEIDYLEKGDISFEAVGCIVWNQAFPVNVETFKKMPIFSNLSRRFHMLTTDAQPDPPRIPIKGYTHNLDPKPENKRTKETKSVSDAATSERCNATSAERKKSLLNSSVPVRNADSSAGEEDLNNAKPPTSDRKKPNVGMRTKSKQHKQSQGVRVVNYNIINSNGVKIGPRTSYICNVNQCGNSNGEGSEKEWSGAKTRQMPPEVEGLCSCTDEITLDDIFIIKNYIGRGWRDVFRNLFYSEGQIEQFEENYRFRGINEVIYQILIDWKQANTKDAEIGNMINALWTCKEYDCAERLVSARNGPK